jgi:hypothetical protein
VHNIITVVKRRKMKRAGHVARMVEMRSPQKLLSVSQKNRDRFEDSGVGMRIILKWVLKEYDTRMCIEFFGLQ